MSVQRDPRDRPKLAPRFTVRQGVFEEKGLLRYRSRRYLFSIRRCFSLFRTILHPYPHMKSISYSGDIRITPWAVTERSLPLLIHSETVV